MKRKKIKTYSKKKTFLQRHRWRNVFFFGVRFHFFSFYFRFSASPFRERANTRQRASRRTRRRPCHHCLFRLPARRTRRQQQQRGGHRAPSRSAAAAAAAAPAARRRRLWDRQRRRRRRRDRSPIPPRRRCRGPAGHRGRQRRARQRRRRARRVADVPGEERGRGGEPGQLSPLLVVGRPRCGASSSSSSSSLRLLRSCRRVPPGLVREGVQKVEALQGLAGEARGDGGGAAEGEG